MPYPSYENWLENLPEEIRQQAKDLVLKLRSLGALDPEGWAQSLPLRHSSHAGIADYGQAERLREIAFDVSDVDGLHADWAARGLTIALAPSNAGFGRSFVALDPDGHRLRPFTLAAR